jgi:hypothetical protein
MPKKYVVLLVALAFFLGSLTGGWAIANEWQTVRLMVDDKELTSDPPAMIINDRTFVPLRVVSEALGASVDWNNGTVFIKTKTVDIKEIKRPPIKGDQEFIDKINAALDLLEEKDFPHYVMVCQNTKGINKGQRAPNDIEGTVAKHWCGYTIILNTLIDDPKRYVPTYLAGTLVHEGCHAVNYNYDITPTEEESFSHQLAVLRLLGSPEWMRNSCENWEDTYMNVK